MWITRRVFVLVIASENQHSGAALLLDEKNGFAYGTSLRKTCGNGALSVFILFIPAISQ
jgi:hypothetical protein